MKSESDLSCSLELLSSTLADQLRSFLHHKSPVPNQHLTGLGSTKHVWQERHTSLRTKTSHVCIRNLCWIYTIVWTQRLSLCWSKSMSMQCHTTGNSTWMHTSGVSSPVILAFLNMLTNELATDELTPSLSVNLSYSLPQWQESSESSLFVGSLITIKI